MLVQLCHQLRTKICSVLLLLFTFNFTLECQELLNWDSVLFVQIHVHKLFYRLLEILWLVMHQQSSPRNTVDSLEPVPSDQMSPYCQSYSKSRTCFNQADTIFLVSIDKSYMIVLWICYNSLYFGKRMLVLKKQNISSFAIFGELLFSCIVFLK